MIDLIRIIKKYSKPFGIILIISILWGLIKTKILNESFSFIVSLATAIGIFLGISKYKDNTKHNKKK
ncbi:MAG: hypothetical protein SPH94_08295 [Fusobacterium necrophorum]|uniref:hypothetical protein n=1 Tax=Fusobacterium necrophorum TaxID=859 RepID=UPI002A9283F7|nr:hypothetical protein [Fusobacterium necrophorum]